MKGINSKIKTVWGISEVGFSITATLETAFFIFFLTDVAQLPLAIWGCARDPGEEFSRRIRCRTPKALLSKCWITSTQGILRATRKRVLA